MHAAGLFRAAGLVSHDVFFSKLAMSVASDDQDTTEFWAVIIKGLIDLDRYEDACSAICDTPYPIMSVPKAVYMNVHLHALYFTVKSAILAN